MAAQKKDVQNEIKTRLWDELFYMRLLLHHVKDRPALKASELSIIIYFFFTFTEACRLFGLLRMTEKEGKAKEEASVRLGHQLKALIVTI